MSHAQPRPHRARGRLAAAVVVALALWLPGCPRSERDALVVFAAASLGEAFSELAREFEARSGVHVVTSFGPSNGLATQILEGAPADVFATANPRWLEALASGGPGVRRRADFATNSLVVVTPADDPGGVASFGDLTRPGLRLVLAAPAVPAGQYAREALAHAGLLEAAERNLASNEEDVKAVVQKLLLGEADAGIVYRTDVTPRLAPRLRVLEVPEAHAVLAVYPIAVLGTTHEPMRADAFVDFVLGPGQATLRRLGFGPPP